MKVFVASPYRGAYSYLQQKNTQFARQCCRAVSDLGHNPYAPHLHDTQFLNDRNPHERQQGLMNGRKFLESCDVVIAFIDRGTSDGMKGDIAYAKKHGIPVHCIEFDRLRDKMRELERERRKSDTGTIPRVERAVHQDDSCGDNDTGEPQGAVRRKAAKKTRRRV